MIKKAHALLNSRWLGLGICLAALIWFLSSRLSFVPVPWPDGSAFYLPGVEFWTSLFQGSPKWRMHAQAAFVPSYDLQNFNTMPALPFLLGLAEKIRAQLGIIANVLDAVTMTRLISMLALLSWAWILWRWLLERKIPQAFAGLIALAGLFDPVIRWGTLVVRTETWIGLAWILILREMVLTRKASMWRIAIFLALAAYFHFEAAFLVPATAVGLWPWHWDANARVSRVRLWIFNLWGVSWRTLILLSPWLLYVLLHLPLFMDQMNIQFHRLARGNNYFSTLYSAFHSLFIAHGGPASWPKFFNVGKGLLWALIAALTIRTVQRMLRRQATPALIAAAVGFFSGMYLWFTKPEVWFTTLCHLFLWPWLAVLLIDESHETAGALTSRLPKTLAWLAGSYAVISILATAVQQQQIPKTYSMQTYQEWVDCIEHTAGLGKPGINGPKKLWQPHVPDVLIELSRRHPELDLTRAIDFSTREPLAWELTKSADTILFTRIIDARKPIRYEGVERAEDRELMKDKVEVPYGHWALERFPVEQPGQWKMQICQVGPFWAGIASRVSGYDTPSIRPRTIQPAARVHGSGTATTSP